MKKRWLLKWKKIGKAITGEGEILYYQAEGTDLMIEVRRIRIQGKGRAFHDEISHVIYKGSDRLMECFALDRAKDYAETVWKRERRTRHDRT